MNAERAFVDARRAVVAITADIAPIVAVLEGDAATAEEVEASFIALCELIRAAGRALPKKGAEFALSKKDLLQLGKKIRERLQGG